MDTFTRKRIRPDDWNDIEASKVVHIRELCEHTLEIDIARALERFGTIRDIAMIPKRRQALVEFEELSAAEEAVSTYVNKPFLVANKPAKINFSTSEHVVKRIGSQVEQTSNANKVLIFFIYDAVYPITVDVITKISKPHGRIVRIFINRKAPVLQALVEFYSIDDAVRVKRHLNGADIYSGCCTLKIDFATTDRVNVLSNTEDSWDFESILDSTLSRHSLLGLPNNNNNNNNRRMDIHNQYEGRNSGGRGHRGGGGEDIYDNDGYNMDLLNHRHPPPHHPHHNHPHQMNDYPPPMDYNNDYNDNNEMMCGGYYWVAMVYGLNVQKINCDSLFNLLCIYGNIMKIKFLKSKEGSAMVQLTDESCLNRIMSLLQNQVLFGQTLQFQVSKQTEIMDVPAPYKLPDGTPSFRNYTESRENRFITHEMAKRNRVFPPSITVNYWNAPPHFGFDSLKEEFTKVGAVVPTEFFQLTDREKSSSGLLQWDCVEDALSSIALCNHILITSEGSKYPYQLKMSFSESPIRHTASSTSSSSSKPRNSAEGGGGNFLGRPSQRGGARGAGFVGRGRF